MDTIEAMSKYIQRTPMGNTDKYFLTVSEYREISKSVRVGE